MAKSAHEIAQMTQSGLNLIRQAISIYDSSLQLAVSNRRFQDMFDLPDHLVQTGASFAETIRHLAAKGDYGPVENLNAFVVERVEQARNFQAHYLERERPNGMMISVEGSPLRQGGWVTVYTDITDIRKHEALLRDRSVDLSEQLLSRSEELSQINRELTATVTALEEAKHELTESESRLHLTNAMTPAHIARVDVDGYYTYTNQKLDTVIPKRPKNILGMHFEQALGQEAYSKIQPHFEKALNGLASSLEFTLKDSGKQIRVAFTPDQDNNGHIVGVYLLSMDLTEEANARRALTHARRRELAAQITSGLAHDFSNLLTIILGQQNKLERLENLSDEVKENVATTKTAALRGGALLDGLSQIDASRSLTIRPIDFPSLINNIEQLAHAAVSNIVEVRIKNKVSTTHLMLDQGFTQDALLNLILNANEATENSGEIFVSVEKVGKWLEFIVKDTGSGFTEQALQNVFTPFFTTKKGSAGRGLGLATVFDFAKISGGRVDVANRKNGGAKISLRIPYIEASSIKAGLVLLVEDNIEIRETIRDTLRKMGHSVLEANSAEEALNLVHISDVTHIITDLMLEGEMTGYDLATHIRESGKNIPIFVVTALPKNNALRLRTAQSFPVLHKPFSDSELTALFQGNEPI